ncbi:hypothetical protein IEQ34_002802 [Dendrobium chrysotoxum]|uniref:Uncharacterized protein n=1 Tax=Dendrobium chrysotoxum TaxID=161865 RepID=A0AAV7HI06_DENCH|nr:hypothetical protein IEQ34_002802 [Dendrobium chrysotoxum]
MAKYISPDFSLSTIVVRFSRSISSNPSAFSFSKSSLTVEEVGTSQHFRKGYITSLLHSFWNTSDEGFIINGHLLKFTSDEVALLTDMVLRTLLHESTKHIRKDCYSRGRYAGGPRGRCPLVGFNLTSQAVGSRGSAPAGVSGGSTPGTNFYCKSSFYCEGQLLFGTTRISAVSDRYTSPMRAGAGGSGGKKLAERPQAKVDRANWVNCGFFQASLLADLHEDELIKIPTQSTHHNPKTLSCPHLNLPLKVLPIVHIKISLKLLLLLINHYLKVYKGYKQPSEIFIQHINPDSVKETNHII